MDYPFQPKSTSSMKAGQFWPLALPNGKFACGMVLDIVPSGRREFLAGLLNWCGESEPTAEVLVGCQVLDQGGCHIKTILRSHGYITGEVPEEHIPEPYIWMDHRGGADYGLYKGLELVEIVYRQRAETYPRRRGWGHDVIQLRAEMRFA